jgi:hypothetical protein
MSIRVLLLLVAWTIKAAAQRVEGTVVNAASGSGIAGVSVELLQEGKSVYSTTSGSRGDFAFLAVRSGNYRVRYSSPDFWPEYVASYEDNKGDPKSFTVTEGGNTVELEGRMIPLARLTGRLIDRGGNPVPQASLLLKGPAIGLAAIPATTDSRGRFDLHDHLLPGEYILVATPPPDFKPPAREPGDDRVWLWTRTYYPGVADPEAAAKIALIPGGTSDVELKLAAIPAHSIKGVVLTPEGKPAVKAAVRLAEESYLPGPYHAESQADGSFELTAVTDGEWMLRAEAEQGDEELRATQWITMAGRDLERITLRLSAPFTVTGRVVIEVPPGAPAPKPPTVVLSSRAGRLARESGRAAPGFSATAQEDGSFVMKDVYPGPYEIRSLPALPYYFDRATMGGIEVRTREVELSGPTSIVLMYSRDGGAVTGKAEGCGSGLVALISQDRGGSGTRVVRTASCGDGGHYEMAAVRPGDYYVVAFTKAAWPRPYNQLTIDGPVAADQLLNRAARVTIRPGETASADVTAINGSR